MSNYYSEHLNARNLQRCYETAPERVKQFLEAEIRFILTKITNEDVVLDLGCGYGRVAIRLVEKARQVVGIDISEENIKLAAELFKSSDSLRFYEMDATNLNLPDESFDVTLCVQNGISAFKVNPKTLVSEALRVTKKGGILLFSSYSGKFWDDRLKWFQIQAEQGLIGEIDYNLTKNGVIVCKDGFRATTFSGNDFLELAHQFGLDAEIYEIDNSSIFCEMKKK